MAGKSIHLELLPGLYAVSQLSPAAPVPSWADGEGFVSIGRTEEELSVVCLEARVPSGVKTDGGWRCFKFQGPFAFDQTGILSSVLEPLARAEVGIFAVSTFNTDYLLVKTENLERTVAALEAAGHLVQAASRAG
ncbi:MAG: ACT domain-containing protein [Meiothermus sp.]|nr:ACT domain-containing protein [Meiothermus sp.]